MNSNDLEARFERVESVIKTENAATRRHFDVVAEGLRDQIKVIAGGHGALREQILDLKEGFRRLETGQSRLELRQLALESRQGQLEKSQQVLLSEVRLVASQVERSRTSRTRRT